MMHFRAGMLKKAFGIQRRNAGGFLRKNIHIEENAGIRENSYKTWSFTAGNILSIVVGTVIPCYLMYQIMVEEALKKSALVGRKDDKFGVVFSLSE